MRQQVQLGGGGTAIEGFNADADVFGVGFSILHENVPVAVVVEDTGVEEFVFRAYLSKIGTVAPVLLNQIGVRIFGLRILVQHAHVAVRGRAVEVEPVFLNILAVDTLVAGKAEHALFEDGVASVPQC